MKITIDEKKCLKHKLTLTECLLALAVRTCQNADEILANMLNREILVKKDGKYLITQHWSDVVDEIISDSSGSIDKSDEEFLELAKQMRDLYPRGKMKNRFGQLTPYYYRCNNSEVIKKLKKFFFLFGNYSDEDILDATKRYVASFRGNYTNMRLIKYFILKDDVKPGEDGNHVEQISDLATFLENKESEEEVGTNEDWTTKMI
jgi:hypothetical protein